MKNKNKIAFIDLETGPILGYAWQLWEADILKVVKTWDLLCFSYKWMGGKTIVVSQNTLRSTQNGGKNDLGVVKELWKVLDEADVVIAHNGDKFDVRKAYAKFLQYNLKPPKPFKTVDTLKAARRYFKIDSNRLDYLGEYLGVGRKIKTGGFELWDKCLKGDRKAWALMERYNKQDVDLLEKVYYKLRPFIVGHPNLNLLNDTFYSCPSCGSSHVQRRGYAITRTNKFIRYQCSSCGAWSQAPSETKMLR